MTDHEMSSPEYRRLMKLVDVDAQSECTSAEFIAMQSGTANDLLRNLDSSKVDTEPNAKIAFVEWLDAVSPFPVRREFRFHPNRRWRFDFAVPELALAWEYDGLMKHGENQGHASIGGILRDIAKLNSAVLLGWLVIRVNAKSLGDGSGYADAAGVFKARGFELRNEGRPG